MAGDYNTVGEYQLDRYDENIFVAIITAVSNFKHFRSQRRKLKELAEARKILDYRIVEECVFSHSHFSTICLAGYSTMRLEPSSDIENTLLNWEKAVINRYEEPRIDEESGGRL